MQETYAKKPSWLMNFYVIQFLGVINDNLLKAAITVWLASFWVTSPTDRFAIALVTNLLFIVPFLLVSGWSGWWADCLDKSMIIRRIKDMEIVGALVAGFGVYTQQWGWMMAAIVWMGLHATIFGPTKFAILRHVLRDKPLLLGNLVLVVSTFAAIIFGSMLPLIPLPMIKPLVDWGWNISSDATHDWISRVVMLMIILNLLLAFLGRYLSHRLPIIRVSSVSQSSKGWLQGLSQIRVGLRYAREIRSVWLSILGISWAWGVGILVLSTLPGYVEIRAHGNTSLLVSLYCAILIGVLLGAWLCYQSTDKYIELGLVPIGSLVLSLFLLDGYWHTHSLSGGATLLVWHDYVHHFGRLWLDLAMASAGLVWFVVPLYALVQERTPLERQGRVTAALNLINAGCMLIVGCLSLYTVQREWLTPAEIWLILSILTLVISGWIYRLLPEFVIRLVFWVLLHTVYRIRVSGHRHIPATGSALLICNHVSFVDAVVIGSQIRRPIRFVMYHGIFKWPILNGFFRLLDAIPIAPAHEDEALLHKAYATIDRALKKGELVCIFPEGKITHSGEMNPFKKGVLNILERQPVPVIPMALVGLWGSTFSRIDGAALKRLFRRGILNRVNLNIGEPIEPQHASLDQLTAAVMRLRGDGKV